jgi:hypothetical protein
MNGMRELDLFLQKALHFIFKPYEMDKIKHASPCLLWLQRAVYRNLHRDEEAKLFTATFTHSIL